MLKHHHPQPLPHFLPLPHPPSFDPVSDLTHQRWISEPIPWNFHESANHRLPPLPPPLRLSKPEAARQNSGFLGRPEIVEAAKKPSTNNERAASGHVGYPNQTLPGRVGRTSGPDIIEDVLRLRIHDRKTHSTSGSSGYGSDVNTTRHRYLKKATGNVVSGRRVASEILPGISSFPATGSGCSVETGSRDEIRFRSAAPLGGAKHVLEKRKPSDNKDNRMNKSLSLKPEMTHYHDSSETGTGSAYPMSPGSRLSRSFGDIRSGDDVDHSAGVEGEYTPVYENGFLADLLRRHPVSLARLTSELLDLASREAQTPKMTGNTSAMNWDSLQKTLTIGCKKGRPRPRPGVVVVPSERATGHQEPARRHPVPVAEPSGIRSKVRRRLFEDQSDEASSSSFEDCPMEGVTALRNNWIESGSMESVGINVDWDDDVELRHRSRAVTSLRHQNDESPHGARHRSIDNRYSKSTKDQTIDDDVDNTYDTIGDDLSFDSTSRSPPPLPPPVLPARNRRIAKEAGHVTTLPAKDPESRTRVLGDSSAVAFESEILDVNAQHIYTISDVLENLRRLASDLPKATESIEGLCQQAAWLRQGGLPDEDAAGKNAEQERDMTKGKNYLEETRHGYTEDPNLTKHDEKSSRRQSRKWGNKLTINSKNSSKSFRSESPGTREFQSTKEEQLQTLSKATAKSRKNKAVAVVKDDAVTTSGSSTLKKKISDRNSKFRKLLVKPEVSRPSEDDGQDGDETAEASMVKVDPGPSGSGSQSDWYQRFPLKKLIDRIQNRERNSRRTAFNPDKTGFHLECGTNPRPSSQLDPKMLVPNSRRASSADRLEANRALDCSRKMKNNCLDISFGSKSKMFKATSSNSSLTTGPPGLSNEVLPKNVDLLINQQDTSLISNRRNNSNPGKLKWIKVCTTDEIFC